MRFPTRLAAAAALASGLATPAVAEADLSPVAELPPPSPLGAARAGEAVALDGDLALVGAPGDAARGADSGAVHVYQLVGGVWVYDATLRPPGLLPGDEFGAAVALEGGVALIGAPGDDGVGSNSGLVYVFERGTGTWSYVQDFRGSQVASGDRFGSALAVDAGTALVGTPRDDQQGNDAGAVYVMRRGVSVWGEQAYLSAPVGGANDHFGAAVAVSGDLAVVGAPAVDGAGVNSGAAYTFARTGNVWSAGAMLPAVGQSSFDAFGGSVATDGARVVVGAPNDDSLAPDGGGAWSFVHDGSSWVVEGALVATLDGGEHVGSAIAVAGDLMVLGASGDDYADVADGSVVVAEWSGLAWVVADVAGDDLGQDSDGLGGALAADGDLVLAGASGSDRGVVDGGHARLWTLSSAPVALPLCLGDGSGAACPCNNPGEPGEGCANSTGRGARLVASGQAVVGADSLQLVVLGAREETPGIFLQGNLELGVPFRDGILCVTHETERLEIVVVDEAGAGGSTLELSVAGHVEAGDTRVYQFWYRDAATGPCGTGSNLSGALQVHWQ